MSGPSPRQQTALANPLGKGSRGARPIHCRRNGNWISALTFDLRAVPDELKDDVKAGQFGVWHGEIGQINPTVDQDEKDYQDARLVLGRLVAGVGLGDLRWKTGDNQTMHVFRLGTISEVAMALRAIEGRREKEPRHEVE